MPSFITEMKKEEERGAHCSGAERVEPVPECRTSVIYVRVWRAFNILRTICHISTHVHTESASVFAAPALKNSPFAELKKRNALFSVVFPFHTPPEKLLIAFSYHRPGCPSQKRWRGGRKEDADGGENTPRGVVAALKWRREAETSLFENVSICA